MYNLLKVMLVIDNDLDIFHMSKVDVDDYYENDLDIVHLICHTMNYLKLKSDDDFI